MGARDVLYDLLRRADDRLLVGWYHAVSIQAWSYRQHLDHTGQDYLIPGGGPVDLRELDRSARWVIAQARFGAGALGGIAGLGGIVSIPPEALAHVVSMIRLGQRLGVVFGFDPATDRGRMALFRALAAGYEVELPTDGAVGLRVSDLPSVVAPKMLAPRTVGSELLGTVLRKAAWTLGHRISRIVPIASAGVSAAQSRDSVTEIGGRMHRLYRQLAEVSSGGPVEDAVEVG